MTQPDLDTRMTKAETTLWGAYGDNGLNSEVRRHRERLGELHKSDEALKDALNTRVSQLREHVDAKFGRLYTLVTTLIVTVLLSAGGIIATLLTTKGSP